jgi:uncharacterized protein YecE (DUF72 family)
VGPEFRFSVKTPRTITHELELREVGLPWARFVAEVSELGDRLGPILVQLPPSLAFDPEVAARFFQLAVEATPAPLVLEARHPSWFADAVDPLLRLYRVSRVRADPPQGGVWRPGSADPIEYVRLHGSPVKYYSPYPDEVLERLAAELAARDWEVWCIFDNTALGAAIPDAIKLTALLDSYRGRPDSTITV